MRFQTLIMVLGVAAVAACASSGVARTVNGVQIKEDKAGLWAQVAIQPDSAIKIALARVPGGQVTEAELEEEDGRLIYSFDVTTPNKTGYDEIHVDAKTGAVVKQEHED